MKFIDTKNQISWVCLSEMRAHIRSCQKYIDKYGPLQELGETATRFVSTHHVSSASRRIRLLAPGANSTDGRDKCPSDTLFCPLCRLLPNENPGSFSGSLIRHLQVNHTLFYDDFIDFNIIEEALIRRVLDRSLLEYVNHSNTT
ncbi:E3 ubiquitin-protein ligase RNF125 [Ailuropoda melanoleuca]|uniref:E3 ubiquitin-protein ligase RNF125 n=1 Tax=Ailuropoda melanoleuca TaxID=9646 RepID=UPI00149483F7|nr:E3 ubiquitin-protein ligase RNF125 [Ailuropoda melanoleuca]